MKGGKYLNQSIEKWMNQGNTVVLNGLLQHYRTLGLDEEELVFVIQLQSFLDKGIVFPNMSEISERMGKKEADIFTLLHGLIQKKIITITSEKDESGKVFDRYSLHPLYKKVLLLFEKNDNVREDDKGINLLEVFQQEFGRLLTPIEMQTIGEWLDRDRYSKELILEALKEAVLNQKYSLRYIDRILLSWSKKNIRTTQQAKEESKRFFNAQPNQTHPDTMDEEEEDIPLFNWLESQTD